MSFFIFSLEAKKYRKTRLEKQKLEEKNLTFKEKLKKIYSDMKRRPGAYMIDAVATIYAGVSLYYLYNNREVYFPSIRNKRINKEKEVEKEELLKINGRFFRENDIVDGYGNVNVFLTLDECNNKYHDYDCERFYNRIVFSFIPTREIFRKELPGVSERIFNYIKKYFEKEKINKKEGDDLTNKLRFINIGMFDDKIILQIVFDFVALDRDYSNDFDNKEFKFDAALKFSEYSEAPIGFDYFKNLQEAIENVLREKSQNSFLRKKVKEKTFIDDGIRYK